MLTADHKQRISALLLALAVAIGYSCPASLGDSAAAAPSTSPQIVATNADTAPPAMPPPEGAAPKLSAGIVASPAPTRTLSLSTCFERAGLLNREILSGRWNVTVAEAGVKIARAIPNPQFTLQAGFGPAFLYDFTGQTQQFFLIQQFQTAGKRTKNIQLAQANLGLAELQLAALCFDVRNRVRRAYAELAAAEAYEALIESERAVGIKLLTIASRRFEAGKAAKSEVLQAQLNVSQFDTQDNQAKLRLEQDSAALAQITGERPERIEVIDVDDNGLFKLSNEKTDIVPQPTRTPPPLANLLATAVENRLDLKAAKQQVYANQKALILAKTKKIPDLFIGVGGTYMTNARNQPAGLGSVGSWPGTGGFFNVTFENPLLYQYQGEVKQAMGNLAVSQRQLDLLESQIATDTVVAYSEVNVSRANILKYQTDLLPIAASVARIARRGYEVGANDLATAIVAQQQYQQTLSSYFDAVVAYQTAWADLEKAAGVPLNL
jgi:cobalt-zinc-cadmium efflux system outer membrane protein